MEQKSNLRGFEIHGIQFTKKVGTQYVGTCVFCSKQGHFYANSNNRLWDCKRCGLRGNFSQFLEKVSAQNVRNFGEEQAKLLSMDRKLPKVAFNRWEFGWNGRSFTLPVRNSKGVVEDLRVFKPGAKMQATTGATLGLLGMHHLYSHPEYPVYVCEGEWDTIALAWLFRKVGHRGSAVGVPGANVLKQMWVPLFTDREVYLLYDQDEAGDNGRRLAFAKLKGVARSVKWLQWPTSLPTGWDVRDMVVEEAIKNKKPRFTLRKIHQLMEEPFEKEEEKSDNAPKRPEPFKGTKTIVPYEEVFQAYKKWLHLKNDEPLRILFGASFANRLQGDPIWMFLVAPPGGMKSELLMSVSKHPSIEPKTSLTPHTLISGFSSAGGADPSLLPKLNGRILVVKDFTTILTMHYTSRDEIFGVLRDCYDGRTEKSFGTGIKRVYESHFGVLAGVTPKIEEFGVMHQSLGERFLKYRVGSGERMSEADRIHRALANINKEVKMREDLSEIANRVLDAKIPEKLPTVSPQMLNRFVNLAQFSATLRGVVSRDRYTQHVMFKPSIEIGTRLAKQLVKLAIGVSIYLGEGSVGPEVYDLVRRVALDTVPDRVEEVVRRLWINTPHPDDALKTAEISQKTRLPVATIFRMLQDLELLRIINRVGSGNKHEWRLHKKVKNLILEGKIYKKPQPETVTF